MEKIWAKYLKKKHLTLKDMRALSADRLQKFGFEFMPFAILRTRVMLSMTPLIDGWALPANTDELLSQGKTLPIPTMIGSTKNDIMVKNPGVKNREKNKVHTSSVEWCKIKNRQGNPAYAYYFSHRLPGDELGAFHSSELWYMFGTLSRCWRPMTEEDYALSERMLDAWVSFIKTGNPGWEACTEENPYVEEFC